MVVFDASVLLLLLDPDASPPNDPATGQPIEHAKARIEHLIATLERQRTKVIIPTPVLSEVLVRAGADALMRFSPGNQRYSRIRLAAHDRTEDPEVASTIASSDRQDWLAFRFEFSSRVMAPSRRDRCVQDDGRAVEGVADRCPRASRTPALPPPSPPAARVRSVIAAPAVAAGWSAPTNGLEAPRAVAVAGTRKPKRSGRDQLLGEQIFEFKLPIQQDRMSARPAVLPNS